MSIVIKKTEEKDINLKSALWDTLEPISIACVNWKPGEIDVKAYGKICHTDEGIYVKLSCDEHPVVVEHRKNNDEVYMDSTMEFFIKPNKNDPHHFNFEINAEGYALIGYGIGRDRIRFPEAEVDFAQFKINTEITDKGFEVFLFIPYDFLLKNTDEISDVITCNLFKCCEIKGHIHHYTAFPINVEVPNFHVADAFGEFVLE